MELLCKAQFFIIYNFSLWWGAIRPEIYCRVFGNFYKNCSLRIKCTPTSNNFSSLWSQFPSIFLVLLLTSKHLLLPPPTKTFSHMIQISLLKPPIPPSLLSQKPHGRALVPTKWLLYFAPGTEEGVLLSRVLQPPVSDIVQKWRLMYIHALLCLTKWSPFVFCFHS